jgi:hypothetical protein
MARVPLHHCPDDLLHTALTDPDHIRNLTGADPCLMQLGDPLSRAHGVRCGGWYPEVTAGMALDFCQESWRQHVLCILVR